MTNIIDEIARLSPGHRFALASWIANGLRAYPMTCDMPHRIAHQDGWLILRPDGAPIIAGWYPTRAGARVAKRKNPNGQQLRVVPCRQIITWKEPS